MKRKQTLVTLLLILIAFCGTYILFKQSTIQALYASRLPDPHQHEIYDEQQSNPSSVKHKQNLYERVRETFTKDEYSSDASNKSFQYEPESVSSTQHELNKDSGGEQNYKITTSNEGVDYNTESMDGDVQLIKDTNAIQDDKNIKTILWYDRQKQSMVGHSTKVNFSRCAYQNCQFKYIIYAQDFKPRTAFQADAVLVQSNAILTLLPPPRRDRNQVFVLGVRDAFPGARQRYRNEVAKRWTGLFNWTMTYRLDSDIVYRYANIIHRDDLSNTPVYDHVFEQQLSRDVSQKDYERIFNEKTGEAIWFVSHCLTKSQRESYVKELQKVINVKIYGFCGEKAPCPKGDTSCFENLSLKYKFYLAFENTFYTDYVTEKVYHWFEKDVIVVARGGSNYSKILPPGTVIDAGDFKSPIELGKHLKELANDKERYIEHLKRKDNYVRTSKLVPVQEANCKLCEYLHTLDAHRNMYPDIYGWWLQNWGKQNARGLKHS